MNRIGVDLGGTKIEAIFLEATGVISTRLRVETPSEYQAKLNAITDLVRQIERDRNSSGTPIGVGHPGSINPRTGLVRNANSTALNGQALDRDLSERLDREVRCTNDANCFTLSEAHDGAAQGYSTVFGVITGTGVGGGLVINGAVHNGSDGNAGEWGHNPLPRPKPEEVPGPMCKCGRQGCIEAWCSGPGLSRDHEHHTRTYMTGQDIAKAAQCGDVDAQASLDRFIDRLGRSLSSVVNIIDPDVIVLGGGLSNLPGLPENLKQAMYPHVFTDEPRTEIVKNKHGDSSGVRGAAWLWPLDKGDE